MDLLEQIDDTKLELQIAPLIDVVFLLLIYFMVTAALMRREGDISFILPVHVEQQQAVDIPVEALIEVRADGTVILEGMQFLADDERLEDLVLQVKGLQEIARSQNAPFFVNIMPHRNTVHQRIIDVMDACAAAGVDRLSFSRSM